MVEEDCAEEDNRLDGCALFCCCCCCECPRGFGDNAPVLDDDGVRGEPRVVMLVHVLLLRLVKSTNKVAPLQFALSNTVNSLNNNLSK